MSLLFVWMMYNEQLNLGIPTLSYSIPEMSRFQLCLDHKHWSNEFQWQMMNVNYATTYFYHNHTTSFKFMLYHTLGNVTDVAKSCGDCWCTSVTDHLGSEAAPKIQQCWCSVQGTTTHYDNITLVSTVKFCQHQFNVHLRLRASTRPMYARFHQ